MFAARNVISPNKPERKRLASNASTLIILYLALQLKPHSRVLGLLKRIAYCVVTINSLATRHNMYIYMLFYSSRPKPILIVYPTC